ncbi:MAG: hypothetical protein DWQ05_18480 [Calditrichaeota bacterium]|nr:MAG: hypothetical protein DWQ05_18480 [Calditrichota bacterium]
MMKRQFLLCILLIFNFTIPPNYAQNVRNFPIENLSIEHGLSNAKINCILQDSRGFIWIGTSNGLNRYDGQEFKVFTHHPGDSISIPSSWIMCLFEDRNNVLWVGTDNGLCRFDRARESFDRFAVNHDKPASLSEPRIRDICETAADTNALWVAIQVGERATIGGLHRFDLETNKITAFQYNPRDGPLNKFVLTYYVR